MDPEERARLVNDAMREYDMRQQVDRHGLQGKCNLFKVSQANVGKPDLLSPEQQMRLGKRLASLKGEEEPRPPPPLRIRGAYWARGQRRPGPRGGRGARRPRPADSDDSLEAETEMTGLEAAGGSASPPSPPPVSRRGRTPLGRSRGPGRPRRRARGGAAGRGASPGRSLLALRQPGAAGGQRPTARRSRPAARRTWSTRGVALNGVRGAAEEQQRTSSCTGDSSSQDGEEDSATSSQEMDGDRDDSKTEANSQGLDIFGNGYACDRDGDDSMVTVFPCVQVVQNQADSGGDSDVELLDVDSRSNCTFSDVVLSGSEDETSPEPPPPRRAPRTVLVRRPGGTVVSAVLGPASRVAVVPGNLSGRGTGGLRRVVVHSRAVPPPPPPPPPAADSSDELSVSETESDDASLAASDAPGREDSAAEMSPDSAVPPAELEAWSRELSSLRAQLAGKEAELRLQRRLLQRETDGDPGQGGSVAPPDSLPPPPELCLRPELVPRRQLREQHVQLQRWALRAALGQRQAQLQATEARRESRRLRGSLGALLTAAQWSALEEGRLPDRWPAEDVERATRLRAACGDLGYQFLQGEWQMPLPRLEQLPTRMIPPPPPPVEVVAVESARPGEPPRDRRRRRRVASKRSAGRKVS